ncbi:hypothetical protein QQ020_03540 [Fulvivirgaceae bacterium BMA12]|uniref:Uncharacterized protein n=1 Tax=Agaribacillus aureus TaxID=3051825 RepID=A0ABT8L3R5_9BACT|nr:hypothetical protein [Fulvivirgaceae bacterium BMA12]
MNIIDFFIGFTLMNAMPHFVLGVWRARILGGFGFGYRQNILYGLFNFVVSISLFIYQYGITGLKENGFYTGALFILFAYFLLGKMLYRRFNPDKRD